MRRTSPREAPAACAAAAAAAAAFAGLGASYYRTALPLRADVFFSCHFETLV